MKQVKKYLLAAAVLFAGLALCTAGEAADVIRWNLGTTNPDPTLASMSGFGDYIKAFCDEVNEKAQGRLIITPHYNSVLGGDVQCLNDIRDGNLEIYHGNPLSGVDPRFGFKALPYLITDFEMASELICNPKGELFLLLKDIAADQNGVMLGVGGGIMRGFINSKHEVRVPSDLRDLTVRTYEDPCVRAFWGPLCNAQALSWAECYTALQTKTVDGMESSAGVIYATKFHEVAKFYTDMDWQWLGCFLIANVDAFNDLPADLQEIVQTAAWNAAAYETERQLVYYREAYDVLKQNGVTVTLITDEERAKWIEYGRSTYGEIRDIIGAETYDKVIAIVDAYNARHAKSK